MFRAQALLVDQRDGAHWCGRIRDEVQAAVFIVHHDNRQGAFCGSSAIDGYVDMRLHAKRDDERGDRRVAITVEKQRDDEDGITLMAQLEVVDLGVDEDGDPITSPPAAG